MKNCVCSIDLGTTTVKAALVDEKGEIIALTRLSAPRCAAPLGAFDAEAYARVVFRTLRKALDIGADRGFRVEGLSLSAQRATIILIDEDSRPIGPALSWQGIACAAEAENFYGRFGAERFLELTGLPQSPIYSVAKLAHLAAEPAGLPPNARVITLHDWMLARLGADELVTDHSHASATGMYDIRQRSWSAEILDCLGLHQRRLPRIVSAGTSAGASTAAVQRAAGLPQDTPLFVGGGDQQCAALGAGAVSGDCVLSLGTAAAVMTPVSELPARTPPGFLLMAHAPENRYLVEGFMSAFGSCMAWAVNTFRIRGAGGLERLAAEAGNSSRVIFLPFLAGSGSPDHDSGARGAFIGLDLSASRADLAQAVLIGLSCEVRRIIDALRNSITINRLAVVGGAGGRNLLPELMADIVGAPLVFLGEREAAILGAAALAWSGLNGVDPETIVHGFADRGSEILKSAKDQRHLQAAYSKYLYAVAALRGSERGGSV